jgi:hypothetical protein
MDDPNNSAIYDVNTVAATGAVFRVSSSELKRRTQSVG